MFAPSQSNLTPAFGLHINSHTCSQSSKLNGKLYFPVSRLPYQHAFYYNLAFKAWDSSVTEDKYL